MRPLALTVSVVGIAAAAVTIAAAVAAQAQVEPRGDDKVRLCHATGNDRWVSIEVSQEGALIGHADHPEDVIPPFGDFPGLNWNDTGQETWDNDCTKQAPEPVHPIGVFGSGACEVGGQSYTATFGYASENAVQVTIAIGSGNFVAPGAADRGQPTVFQPGRVEHAFAVANVPLEIELTWSVTYAGETRSAAVEAPSGCGATPPPTRAVTPFVACVDPGASTYTAVFGTNNPNADTVYLGIGPENSFSPVPEDRGQGTDFAPGRTPEAVTVSGIPLGVSLTWALDGGNATATSGFDTRCEVDPPITPEPPVSIFVSCVDRGASTFTARFGYSNPGTIHVQVSVGDANRFTPTPENRGQPIVFEPGQDDDAVEVQGVPNGADLVWTLRTAGRNRTATAGADFATACTDPPDPPDPKPVAPFARCVDVGSTSYSATFATSNPNDVAVTIAVGVDNRFVPAPADRGQGTVFAPGTDLDAVTISDIPLAAGVVWVLNGLVAEVRSDFPTRCDEDPPNPPLDRAVRASVTCVVNGSQRFEAQFGYVNENATTVEIPIGANNRFSPDPDSRGQPTLFAAGAAPSAFGVTGIPNGSSLAWTVSFAGETRTATASADFATKCAGPPDPPDPADPPDPPDRGPARIPARRTGRSGCSSRASR